jgi:hypothetical protein
VNRRENVVWSCALLVTSTVTDRGVCGGDSQCSSVDDTEGTDSEATVPNRQVDVARNSAPTSVTTVEPAMGPLGGNSDVITTAAAQA